MPAVFLNSLFISALLRHLLLCAVAIWNTAEQARIMGGGEDDAVGAFLRGGRPVLVASDVDGTLLVCGA